MKRGLLLSGGIDSTALAWWKRPEIAYTVDYGHSAAAAEIKVSARICRILDCEHHVIRVDLLALGCGPLAGKRSSKLSKNKEWWPFRNQLLLTIAGMHGVQNAVKEIMIGTVRSDKRHADGTSRFVRGMDKLMSLQEGHIVVTAPALSLDSVQLVKKTKVPHSLLMETHSCHRGNGSCCQCPGCIKRMDVLQRLDLVF